MPGARLATVSSPQTQWPALTQRSIADTATQGSKGDVPQSVIDGIRPRVPAHTTDVLEVLFADGLTEA